MKTLPLIRRQIQPALEELENLRIEKLALVKKGQQWNFIPIVLLVVAVASFFLTDYMVFGVLGIILSIGLFIGIYVSMIGKHKEEFKTKFKKELLNAFVKALYPNATFQSQKKVSQTTFKSSELFGSIDNYSGEDLFKGQTENGCNFQFSEIRATRTTRSGDSNSTTVVFDGLFFLLQSKKELTKSKVLVLPDAAEKTMGKLGKFLQKKLGAWSQGGKLIYMKEHPEFEKEYVVYAQSEQEAHSVLTPTLIGALYNLKFKWKTPLHVSFIGSNIYIGVSNNENYFEADINKSILDNQELKKLYNQLAMCFTLIEDFSTLEADPENYDATNNWKNEAYDHFNDSNNPFLL